MEGGVYKKTHHSYSVWSCWLQLRGRKREREREEEGGGGGIMNSPLLYIVFDVEGYLNLIGCFTSPVFNQVGLVGWLNNRLGRCHFTMGLQSLVSLYL